MVNGSIVPAKINYRMPAFGRSETDAEGGGPEGLKPTKVVFHDRRLAAFPAINASATSHGLIDPRI
jgi:hypothetical protein